jgi:DNA-binding MarR family transcriptional regulator
MRPDMDDVQQMTQALFTVKSGLDRAARRSPKAGRLNVLYVVGALPGVSPKVIARELDLNPSSITRQVQALEHAGYVTVAADEADRRSCRITLTDVGRDELRQLNQIGLERFAKFVADWDAEEVRTLTRLLWKLEASKAEVAAQEQRADGRHWQRES